MEKSRVYYNYNSRTKQQMPHHIQFLEDYLANEDRFSVEKAVKILKEISLIIHGSEDEAVPFFCRKFTFLN